MDFPAKNLFSTKGGQEIIGIIENNKLIA